MLRQATRPTGSTIIPDGVSLTVASITQAARDFDCLIELTPEIRKRVIASRALLDEFVDSGRIIYGVTTSVGGFVNWLIPPAHAEETQNNVMRSVQSNCGRHLDDHYVRASMLARINSLSRGYSAISIENLEKYVQMYNRGVLPCIPEKGSLGTSGDLGPLACIGLVGTGQWRAKFNGEIMSGAEALQKAGIEPMKLSYKEGLALINGTSVMTAVAACLVAETIDLIKAYTLATCLSLEVHKAKIMPFHPAAHRQKPHAGQGRIADCIYRTLDDSKMIVKDAEVEKWLRNLATDTPLGLDQQIEDVYSIRATPQIMGPVIDTTLFVKQTVETEINSSNDNPLIVVEDGDAVHNANFHGQYIANAMDQLAIVIVNMCNLSDRRNNRLLHPSLNGDLPPFLVKENPGVRMGLMGGQFLATSLTAEVRQMCTPMSIQSLPSTGDFQDHVSFGLVAARRTRDILDNARHILAFELICACQAADIRGVDQLCAATRKLHGMVRKHVPYLDHDEPLTDHIETIAALFASGELLQAVPQNVDSYNW
ncbi:MAG: aromatic amino acid ammonia-lyase [Gammaproteobacteria bacterium]|nr:aromatic amino acid ammonia-lyase [Gammaproteobacteria bacterium]MDH3434581.1 aromatic amino acid ammonia-lyase [Gammaproteobacteria bacterium]